MSEPPSKATALPDVLGQLDPARRAALRNAYAQRLAAGDDKERVIGELALQHGIAPSFVRILLGPSEG